MQRFYTKDPSAILDYKFDWKGLTNSAQGARSDYLESGETISSHTVTASSGLTVDSSSLTDSDTSVTAWISGGTLSQQYKLVCHIVTSAGRTDERTMLINVQDL